MKEMLKDIYRNFALPLVLGVLMVLVFTLYVKDFDSSNIHWYYIGITIASGGGIACMVYLIKKMLKK